MREQYTRFLIAKYIRDENRDIFQAVYYARMVLYHRSMRAAYGIHYGLLLIAASILCFCHRHYMNLLLRRNEGFTASHQFPASFYGSTTITSIAVGPD
jgi:hypothetical protein